MEGVKERERREREGGEGGREGGRGRDGGMVGKYNRNAEQKEGATDLADCIKQ